MSKYLAYRKKRVLTLVHPRCLQAFCGEYNCVISTAGQSTTAGVLFLGMGLSMRKKVLMFTTSDLEILSELTNQHYRILVANGHDITISSLLTGHEWVIVSDYGCDTCYILHRHSRCYPFHPHHGFYKSMADAFKYIEGHDIRHARKKAGHKVPPSRRQ